MNWHYGEIRHYHLHEEDLDELYDHLLKYYPSRNKTKHPNIRLDLVWKTSGSSLTYSLKMYVNLLELNLVVSNACYCLKSMNRHFVYLPNIQKFCIISCCLIPWTAEFISKICYEFETLFDIYKITKGKETNRTFQYAYRWIISSFE